MLQKTVRQHTANYIEHTGALTKIMVVQIGKDNTIRINRDVLDEIFLSIKQYNYETGGIIGVNKRGVITVFQFDKSHSSCPFEYSPNVDFLNQIINGKWANEEIEFVGFVHSHLNNDKVSLQDIIYCRRILKKNSRLSSILIGIINLSEKNSIIKWYIVCTNDVLEVMCQGQALRNFD